MHEIITIDPFTGSKKGTVLRGMKWNEVAENLSQLKDEVFKVDQRAVRDRYNLLSQKYKKKMKEEERASGISPDPTEVESALETIIEMEESAEEDTQQQSANKKLKDDEEKANAENIRMKAMTKLSQKRNGSEDKSEGKKKRRSGPQESLDYLKEKRDMNERIKKDEMDLRREELELRKKELDIKAKEHESLMDLLQQQQQQMLSIFSKLTQK